MLDVAMDSKLAPCLGSIMNKEPYRAYSTNYLLQKLTDCPLSGLDSKKFMQFWLFDSEIPILIISATSISSEFGDWGTIKLSHELLCPWNYLRKTGCNKTLEPEYSPYIILTLHDISGRRLTPKILYNRESLSNHFVVNFNPVEKPLFIANLLWKKSFLIQYPISTYVAFIRWCFDSLQSNNHSSLFGEGTLLKRPLTFFVFDMFQLALRNIISTEWLFVLAKWIDDFPRW